MKRALRSGGMQNLLNLEQHNKTTNRMTKKQPTQPKTKTYILSELLEENDTQRQNTAHTIADFKLIKY